MSREEFIDNLRLASQMLAPPVVHGDMGPEEDAVMSSAIDSADFWLTTKYVDGFDVADFQDWPEEDRRALAAAVENFRNIAQQVPAEKRATTTQSKQARKYLQQAIGLVRNHLLPEWIAAQRKMIDVATAAARARGWYVEEDEKEVLESLFGAYKAPRLRIKTRDNEVVLDPVARFGSGRQGVVDLIVMPTYETAYLVAFKHGDWQIVSPHGTQHRRPFSQVTLVNTITSLSRQ